MGDHQISTMSAHGSSHLPRRHRPSAISNTANTSRLRLRSQRPARRRWTCPGSRRDVSSCGLRPPRNAIYIPRMAPELDSSIEGWLGGGLCKAQFENTGAPLPAPMLCVPSRGESHDAACVSQHVGEYEGAVRSPQIDTEDWLDWMSAPRVNVTASSCSSLTLRPRRNAIFIPRSAVATSPRPR